MSSTTPEVKQTLIGRLFGQPFQLRAWEATGIRVLLAYVIYRNTRVAMPSFLKGLPVWLWPEGELGYLSQPKPNGIAHLFDLTFLANSDLQLAIWLILVICLIGYISGRWLVIFLPIITALFTGGWTLTNSQGFIGHYSHLLGLVLWAQTAVILVRFFQTRKAKPADGPAVRLQTNRYLYYYALIAIAAAYVVAGASKLIQSDGEWVENSHYSGLYLIKTYRQGYYSDLSEEYSAARVPYAYEMLEYPNFTRIFMAGGLLLELFCFVALFHRSLALITGVCLMVFHEMVSHIMNLNFLLYQQVLFVLLVNPVFLVGMGIILAREWTKRNLLSKGDTASAS